MFGGVFASLAAPALFSWIAEYPILIVAAALLTAFYMTRQAVLVFLTPAREPGVHHPHESPKVMLVPLYVLATFAVLLSLIGTPIWPWFERWMEGESAHYHGFGALFGHGGWVLILISLIIVTVGVGSSWMIYRRTGSNSQAPDPLQSKLGGFWHFLVKAMGFDALYEKCIIEPLAFFAGAVDMLERMIMVPLMAVGEAIVKGLGYLSSLTDENALNRGFNRTCDAMKKQASLTSACISGRPQAYLRSIGLGMSALFVLYLCYLWIAST